MSAPTSTPWTLDPRQADLPATINLIRAMRARGEAESVLVSGDFLLRQLEEVWWWRTVELNKAISSPDWYPPGSLIAALEGKFYDSCIVCDGPMIPGQTVANFSEVGIAHPNCCGATEEDIRRGRFTLSAERAVEIVEYLSDEDIESLRADPSVQVFRLEHEFRSEAAMRAAIEARREAFNTYQALVDGFRGHVLFPVDGDLTTQESSQ